MVHYYNSGFNQNEWYIIGLLAFYVVVFILPKRFPLTVTLMFILYGISVGRFWDQLISTPALDFYDNNDSSKVEFFDFLLYCSYGSFSYIMVYIFDRYELLRRHSIIYILYWSLMGTIFERLGTAIGVFHYKNGYQLLFSFPIYLITYSTLFILYYKAYKLNT